ncbi:MAG: zf-TFIIB domain-containing protein [bacterium]
MKCPRCETTVLDEKTRDGVVIDACHECRGIWLDRGELEKLIARSGVDEYGANRQSQRGRRDDDDDDDDDDRMGSDRGGRRRGGFLGSLGDLFD